MVRDVYLVDPLYAPIHLPQLLFSRIRFRLQAYDRAPVHIAGKAFLSPFAWKSVLIIKARFQTISDEGR